MKTLRICITGASRGIGRELALQLAHEGHHLLLVARNRTLLEAVRDEALALGATVELLVHDVTKEAPAVECDVLVNNAGSCTQEWFVEQSLESQRAEFELNYWGAVKMTRAVLPLMLKRRSGRIINVSSMLGSIASPSTANYGATKAALESWSLALRRELAGTGVTATVFVSPHTQTEMGKAVKFEGVVSVPISYTASKLVFAVKTAPRRFIGSPVYVVLLFLARMFPAFMEGRVAATAPGMKKALSP